MRILSLLLLFSLALLPAPAAAHTGLKASTPADGAVLAAHPDSLQLVFNGPVRLLKVELLAAASAVDRAPRPQDTGFKQNPEPTAEFTISTAIDADIGEQPKDFILNWAAMGADGHIITGTVRFSCTHQ